ncbi:hypothetical protein L596_013445 [Steinernema carpocapsae]|uniref:Uncharacterized protein n=1 Tax=Steinernema carpocapsae TaxID=34508 RepID=A0A4U5P057_STECR|nr:hypothetical protein L596_013445 [Steinernema carpocapsae]
MVRVGVDPPTNGNGRGSPSEVFSSNTLQMDNRTTKRRDRTRLYKWIALISSILAVLFMLSTIALAVVVGIKVREEPEALTATETTLLNDTTSETEPPKPEKPKKLEWPKPSGSLNAIYKRAAIATDHGLCSEIGRGYVPREFRDDISLICLLVTATDVGLIGGLRKPELVKPFTD